MVKNQVTPQIIACVTNTLNGAMHAMDSGDDDLFASFFVPEAQLQIKVSGTVRNGRDEIGSIASGVKAKFPTAQHWEGNIFISRPHIDEIKLEHIKASIKQLVDAHGHLSNVPMVANKSYWKAVDGGDVIAQGEHNDILVQMEENGPWLIVLREIAHTWTKTGGYLDKTAAK